MKPLGYLGIISLLGIVSSMITVAIKQHEEAKAMRKAIFTNAYEGCVQSGSRTIEQCATQAEKYTDIMMKENTTPLGP